MHPSVLKHCASSLVEPVTKLFNLSLSTSKVPDEWKVHKICPIPKSKDVIDVTKYRPISLLCILSKVLESLVYDRLISFVRPQLSKSQFGFLKNRSCITQLLLSYSKITESMEIKCSSDVIFLDFAKAFDSVPHGELLYKIWKLGITGPLWFWLQDYLSDRFHYVSIENGSSKCLSVLSGVPQGSVLGPLLFLIYINDLPDSISFANVYLFADDAKLVKSILSFNDSAVMQKDLDALQAWCIEWTLKLNTKKCSAISFGRSDSDHFPYAIGDTPD